MSSSAVTARCWVPTEPGTPMARSFGCTCPEQNPEQLPGGGARYRRDVACPLHVLNAAESGNPRRWLGAP